MVYWGLRFVRLARMPHAFGLLVAVEHGRREVLCLEHVVHNPVEDIHEQPPYVSSVVAAGLTNIHELLNIRQRRLLAEDLFTQQHCVHERRARTNRLHDDCSVVEVVLGDSFTSSHTKVLGLKGLHEVLCCDFLLAGLLQDLLQVLHLVQALNLQARDSVLGALSEWLDNDSIDKKSDNARDTERVMTAGHRTIVHGCVIISDLLPHESCAPKVIQVLFPDIGKGHLCVSPSRNPLPNEFHITARHIAPRCNDKGAVFLFWGQPL